MQQAPISDSYHRKEADTKNLSQHSGTIFHPNTERRVKTEGRRAVGLAELESPVLRHFDFILYRLRHIFCYCARGLPERRRGAFPVAEASVARRERQNIVIKSYLIVPRLMKLFLRSICILVYVLKFNFVAAGAIGGRLFFGVYTVE